MEGKQIVLQYLLAAVLRRAVRNDGAVGVATAHPLASTWEAMPLARPGLRDMTGIHSKQDPQ